MAKVFFLQAGSPAGGVCTLLQQSVRSVLSDYSDAVPEDMVDMLYELAKSGLRIHDLTHEADPKRQGMLISRGSGENITLIAFIRIPRKLFGGGLAVDICRFDKENRIDTLEMKPVTSWN